jgi:hypothetical protein
MEDGMYMLARVLRSGETVAQAAPDFGVHQTTGALYFRSHARALAEMLRRELPPPTQAEIFQSTPDSFKETLGFDDVEMMVDATGIKIGHVSNPELARSCWSTYYKMVSPIHCLAGIVMHH